ncbi:MAG: TIGR00374 family protein [Candidatus Pacearchaeota archaeon]|nr:MAG: TIGR00374 family protein [Candidatus Pacearchaeota archaeon]
MKIKIRFLVSLVIFLFLIYFLTKIDFYQSYLLLKKSNVFLIFIAFILIGINFLIFSLRSVYSLRKIKKVDFFFNLKTVMANFFINGITPGFNLGGEPFRAYYLSKKYKKPAAKILGAIVADKFYHSLVSFFFIVATALYVMRFIPISFELKTLLQTLIFFVLFFFLSLFLINLFFHKERVSRFAKIIYKKILKSNRKKNKFIKYLDKHFENFFNGFRETLFDKKFVILAIFLSLIYWLIYFLVSYLIFLSFGFKISFFVIISVVSLSNLLGDFSPTPGGVGLMEGSMVLFYTLFGVSVATGLAVSIISRLLLYFYSIFIGGISLISLERNTKKKQNLGYIY